MDPTPDQIDRARPRISFGSAVAEDQVVWNFLRSEIDSPRWSARLLSRLSPALATKVRSGDHRSVTGPERTELRHALRAHRGRFVEGLLQPTATWKSVILDTAVLPELRVIAEKDFVERAPSRLLGEFVAAADARVRSIPDFDVPYAQIRASFDPRRSRGVPILVATDAKGPYTIAEGLTRLTCLVSLKQQGRVSLESVDAILGVDPRLATWKWI